MTLPLVTSAIALFYLSAIPVRIAFRLRTGTAPHFGVGVSLFEARFARAGALTQFRKTSSPKKLPPKELLRSARYLLRHTDELRIDGVFGAGDAALTALVCGAVSSAGHAFTAASRRAVIFALRPDFSCERLRVDASGIVSLRAGHIILAALLGAYDYATGRFQQWTSTPSKAL